MCKPPVPEGCLTIVSVLVAILVIRYSKLPVSPKLTISPTEKPVAEVIVTDVSPTAKFVLFTVVF